MPNADEHRPPGQDRRIEPTVDWARVAPRTPAARDPSHPTSAWRDRPVWRWALPIAVLALVLLLVLLRRPLADVLWPDTRIQQLLEQADSALREGRLDAPDGSGARQLFEAAQALDTDRSEATRGLQHVAQAALKSAGDALQQNRFDEARRYLALARELQVPRVQADAVAARLRAREVEHAGVDAMLLAARGAHAAGRLADGGEAALPLYQRVLALQPARLEALEGREDALSDLLQQAQRELARGDLSRASLLIGQARGFDSGHVDLPQAQAALARAIDARRAQGDRDLRHGRLESALAAYQAVVAAAPEDARARQGMEQLGAAYAHRAEQKAKDFAFDQARQDLGQARALAPQSAQVAHAAQSIARSRQAQTRLDTSLPPRERDRRVKSLLSAMAQAEAQGNWITPPGESAYDKLRAAQALAPEQPTVRQAAARLLPAVRGCFEDELRGNRIRRAQSCQQAWQTLHPGDPKLADARRRLAEKWIAVGAERLGAGDVAFARQALEEARRLDAQASGLDAFAERVRTAQAGQAP